MEKASEIKIIADENLCGKRIDSAVASLYEDLSRSQIQKHIKNGQIRVNGREIKPSYVMDVDDEIEIFGIEDAKEITIEPQNIPLDIKYEDDDIIVVNKPAGMLTHPTATEKDNTLVNALLYYTEGNLSDINGNLRPGIVHRLDRDTSGLLLIAKNNKTHEFLQKQIKEKTAIRKYVAVLTGVLNQDNGIIETNYGRHPTKPCKMAVLESGKIAVTHFKVLERFSKNTFAEFELKTGRTHQIRVHSQYIHHPIVNDTLYGGEKLKVNSTGQILQAYDLTFRNMKNETINIKIDYDEDVKKVLTYLKNTKI